MTPHQTLAILVRIFCVGLVAYSFQTVFLSLDLNDLADVKFEVAYFGLSLLLSAILWRFPMLISGAMIRADTDGEKQSNWSTKELYSLGFVIVGLMWLILALSDLIYWISFAIYASHAAEILFELDSNQKAAIISTVFEVLISLTLIFGSRGWLRIVWYLRFGVKNDRKSS